MRRTALALTLVAAAVWAAGCGRNEETATDNTAATETPAPTEPAPVLPPVRTAMAVIQPLGGGQVSGEAHFTQNPAGGVDVHVALQNATGQHGLHIHEGGTCGPDGKAAGPHWNPTSEAHGMIGTPPHHAGDLGNYSGSELRMTVPTWTIGDGGQMDVVGHTIVVHAKADDLKTDPAGNSGDRIACGVITLGGATPTEVPVGSEMTPSTPPTSQ
jgi:Cu-Zn family superoxide dismutase